MQCCMVHLIGSPVTMLQLVMLYIVTLFNHSATAVSDSRERTAAYMVLGCIVTVYY